MRLYSRTGATAVDAPEGHFEPVEDGGFDFPDALSTRMHATHVDGVQQWETAIERQRRVLAEEAERRQDPATLLAAVEKIVNIAETAPAPPAPATRQPRQPRAPRTAKK
jgi:hypothetical protein